LPTLIANTQKSTEEKKLRSWEAGKLRKGKDRSEEDENCTAGRMGSPKIPLDLFIDQ
jgi:hypothetical protein